MFDQIGHFADPAWIQDRGASIVKDRQRHTPATLSRNAPVRAGLDGRVDSISAPLREPIDLVDRLKCSRLQEVDSDKELFDGAKNHGSFGTPTVWISVRVIVYRKQTFHLLEPLNHVLICVKNVFSYPFRDADFLGVAPVIVHG